MNTYSSTMARRLRAGHSDAGRWMRERQLDTARPRRGSNDSSALLMLALASVVVANAWWNAQQEAAPRGER